MIPESTPMVWLLYALGCGPEARPVDADEDARVAADEVCNGLDDDRDGLLDEDATHAPTWYVDGDGDGVGVEDDRVAACEAPPGYAAAAGDCDDASPSVSPLVADADRACGDGLEDCSRSPCRWTGRHELDGLALATWTGEDSKGKMSLRGATNVGDVDGDGRPDFAIDQYVWTGYEPGDHPEGAGSTYTIELDATLNQVRGAGDVDGDGRDDLVVTAVHPPAAPDGRTGWAWVVRAPAPGRIDLMQVAQPLGDPPEVGFATGVGDMDGDGYGDIVIAHAWDGLAIYPGSSNGMTYEPEGRLVDPSNELLDGVIDALAAVGDVDGDGVEDFAVGGSHSWEAIMGGGAVCLFTHLPAGAATLREAADVLLTGAEPMERAGMDVDGAGDVDGDGYDDLLVGNLTYAWGETYDHTVNLWVGSLVLGPIREDGSLGDADARFFTDSPGDAHLGARVRGLGDLDADGRDDFAFGLEREGVVYVYYGAREGTQSVLDADAQFAHGVYYAVGWSFDGIGDVDGDGFGDLLIGSPAYDQSRGMAFLVPGWAP